MSGGSLLADEYVVLENKIGTVTNRRLRLNERSPGKKTPKDIPLRHITTISNDVERHPFVGAGFVIGGLVLLFQNLWDLAPMLVGLLGIAFAALLITGWPGIRLRTSDGIDHSFHGKAWQKDDVAELADAIRSQLACVDP